jgi:hypothetical protein
MEVKPEGSDAVSTLNTDCEVTFDAALHEEDAPMSPVGVSGRPAAIDSQKLLRQSVATFPPDGTPTPVMSAHSRFSRLPTE